MSENALILVEKLFSSDKTDKGQKIKNELIEAYNNYIEDPSKRIKKLSLTSNYFKLVSYIFKKRIPEDDSFTFNLTITELYAIDYGYIFPDLVNIPISEMLHLLTKLNWNTGSDEYLKFHSISGYINYEFHKMMGYFDLKRMDNSISKLEEEYNIILNEKKEILTTIISEISNLYSGNELLSHKDSILKMNTNLYRLTEAKLTMKKKIQEGQALSADERTNLITVENNQSNLKRERNSLYKEHKIEHKIIMKLNSMEDKYFKKIDEAQNKFYEIERAKKKRENFKKKKNSTPLSEKEEFITEKIGEIQNLVDFAAKRSKVVAFPFLTKKIAIDLPEKIQETFRECEKYDQKLFKNKEIRLYGMPGIIIGPGNGESFFNYENSMFYIPLNYSNKLEDSVINGIVIYKWDMDESRELRDSFNELKKYRSKSFVELQKGLIKEYHTYITKECRGYKVMDKDVKEWFTWQIAPNKEELQEFEERTNSSDSIHSENDEIEIKTVENIVDEEKEVTTNISSDDEDIEENILSDRSKNNFYRRINKILKWHNVRDRIIITPSEKHGDIDITIKEISLDGMESELIFNALLIQAKLKRFKGLEKENWNKKILDDEK